MNNAILHYINSLFSQITGSYISFQPLMPFSWLLVPIIIILLLVFYNIFLQKRGGVLRLFTLASLLLVLANPVFTKQQKELVPSIIGVVVDKSPSQNFDNRAEITADTLEKLKNKLALYPQYTPRFINAGMLETNENKVETKLFTALDKALEDVPSNLYAGTIMITDGEVHDVAFGQNIMAAQHPFNVILTGKPNDYDRNIKIIDPPRFGIKNSPLTLSAIVTQEGTIEANAEILNVALYINGEKIKEYHPKMGEAFDISLELPVAGKNIVELRTPIIGHEVSTTNNQTAIIIDAIRQNLRVLLVSGEPHNGERAWRDLLKSDASIDLVHFTILRPPEKADNTPFDQLSLIVFPTTELFVDRLKDFDLVIFDRYQHYDVLPLIYYDYIAQYVKNGGALLMATGPEYSGDNSLALTPLLAALPAFPTGTVIEKPFRPKITPLGLRHPVTRGLISKQQDQDLWGPWLRQIDVKNVINGQIVMNGADDKPLLILSHLEKGRVAMLLSDEGWLWARGFEGGGPYAALYRRIAHWLMQEPELEEESLIAFGDRQKLNVRLQTMGDKVDTVRVETPLGKKIPLNLQKQQEGVYAASLSTDEVGIFKVISGDKQALALIGPLNSPEYTDVIATKRLLMPVLQKSGGFISFLRETQKASIKSEISPAPKPDNLSSNINIPNIKMINADMSTKIIDEHNLILEKAEQTRIISTKQSSFFSDFLALFICLSLLSALWYREGK